MATEKTSTRRERAYGATKRKGGPVQVGKKKHSGKICGRGHNKPGGSPINGTKKLLVKRSPEQRRTRKQVTHGKKKKRRHGGIKRQNVTNEGEGGFPHKGKPNHHRKG